MDYLANFENRYRKLNERQKEAVDTIDGPVLVIAGPGSGKTELLSLRVANILKLTDTLPSSILCLTFTDAAAINMRRRLAGLIGAEAYKVAIHTFHSFGKEIINQNPEYFYQGAFYKPADDLARREIMEEIFSNLKHSNPLSSFHPEQGYTYLRETINRIGELKKAGLSPEEFKKIIAENAVYLEQTKNNFIEIFADRISKKTLEKIPALLNELKNLSTSKLNEVIMENLNLAYLSASEQNTTKPLTEWKDHFTRKNKNKETVLKDLENLPKQLALSEIYKEYQKILHQKGFFDFEDMIMDTTKSLEENSELKYNLQEKYQYVLVDEFQDTNGVQMRLLDNLLNNEINEGRPNILAVGDDDQAIFKFQGANIENILSFHKKYREPKIIVLNQNYRSSQNILDLVRKIIIQGHDRLENRLPEVTKELKAANSFEGKIIEQKFSTNFHELIWLAEEIQQKLADGTFKAKEIAIIAPKHKNLEETAKFLDHFNIPVTYERKQNLLENKYVLELIAILEFINTLNQKDQEQADGHLPKILGFNFLEIDRIDIWKISTTAYKENQNWLEIMLAHSNKKIKNFAELLINLGTEAKEKTVEEIIDTINNKTPYKEYYLKESPVEFLISMQAFISVIREHTSTTPLAVNDLINFITLHKKHQLPLNFHNTFGNEENAVHLLTVHGSKGLEFETVFIINCQEDVWFKDGGRNNLPFPENLPLSPETDNQEDKLRKFYVALTRVKKILYITYHQFHDSGKEQVPLRFLENDSEFKKAGGVHSKKIEEAQNKFAKEKGLEEMLELKLGITKHKLHNQNETDFLKNLVQDYKLSATHFNKFLNLIKSGPQKFAEDNLLRFPELPALTSAYGRAVHLALNQIHRAYKDTKNLPTLQFLLDQFERALIKERLNKKNFAQLLEKGTDHLTIFYNNQKDNFIIDDESEYDFRRQGVMIGAAELTGKIDKLRYNKAENEVIVFDYKTGKPITNWKTYEYEDLKSWENKNQLIFYKLLVENARDFKGLYKVRKGVLEFIQPEGEDTKTLELDITQEDTERMKKLIQIVYKKIINLDFPDTSHYEKNIHGIHSFIEDLLSEG